MPNAEFDRLGRGAASGPRQLARRALIRCLPPSRFVTARGAQWLHRWTFDDGPHPEHTPRILDVLGQYGLSAAFFMIGEAAERQPDLVRRIVAEGHLLGSHSYAHPAAGTLHGGAWLDEMRRGRTVIEQIIGRSVPAFRPPHGHLELGTLGRLLVGDWQIVLWSVDPKDYAAVTAEAVIDHLHQARITERDIVLLHDTAAPTAQALESYLATVPEGTAR